MRVMSMTKITRKEIAEKSKRIVVKVGSRLIADMKESDKVDRINQLIEAIAEARNAGFEIILVSSGAIGVGMKLTGRTKRPDDLAELQALAAVGQGRLMSIYENACQKHGFHGAQILLSADDVKDRKRHLNFCNCIYALLKNNILPIINENDTVNVEEICFGDNDRLAALVGTMVRADLCVLLTTVNGLHERGIDGQFTDRIPLVETLSDDIKALASGTDGNQFSTGGMQSKLDAADIVMRAGEHMIIADGSDFSVINQILSGEDKGTLFPAISQKMLGSKRWLAFFAEASGDIKIDSGAENAITSKGRSLLAKGIISIDGQFKKGDTINIFSGDNKIAVGRSNYNSEELSKILGCHSKEFKEILGHNHYDEVVHRNNMVIL